MRFIHRLFPQTQPPPHNAYNYPSYQPTPSEPLPSKPRLYPQPLSCEPQAPPYADAPAYQFHINEHGACHSLASLCMFLSYAPLRNAHAFAHICQFDNPPVPQEQYPDNTSHLPQGYNANRFFRRKYAFPFSLPHFINFLIQKLLKLCLKTYFLYKL